MPLVAQPTGMGEDLGRVALGMLGIDDAALDVAQQLRERSFAGLNGLPAQVAAVELQEIEGEQERRLCGATARTGQAVSSGAPTSPSIRQLAQLSLLTAARTIGKRAVQS